MSTTELEAKTLQYWLIRSYPLSAGDAIAYSNDLLRHLNPARYLASLVNAYLIRIIEGGHRKKLAPRDNVVNLNFSTRGPRNVQHVTDFAPQEELQA
jgi:hypothetical protein